MSEIAKAFVACGIAKDGPAAHELIRAVVLAFLISSILLTLYAVFADRIPNQGTGVFPEIQFDQSRYAESHNVQANP